MGRFDLFFAPSMPKKIYSATARAGGQNPTFVQNGNAPCTFVQNGNAPCALNLSPQFVSSICLLNWSRCLNKHVYMATGYIIITGHPTTRPAAAPPRSRRSGGSRIVWGPSPEPRGVDRVAPQGEIPLPADVWGPRARAPGPARGPRAPVPRAMALGPWPLPPWKIPLPADVWGPGPWCRPQP